VTDAPSSGEHPHQWWDHPRLWLTLMVVVFFGFSVYTGLVAYADFQTQNSVDAGIVTQAVASTALGHNAPYFESYDCMVKVRCSFLLVHPGVILYAAVPFYQAAPSTTTLFALRSAIVAAAAIPLYWLTRQVTGAPWKGLAAAGIFLVWAPTFAADAFSLHLESLLPLELFSLAALWVAGRYRAGLLVAVAAFFTIEVAPIFTFLLGVFFLFPVFDSAVRRGWSAWRDPNRQRSTWAARSRNWSLGLRSTLVRRDVLYTLVLLGSSAVAYVGLASFMNLWGYQVLGVISPQIHPGISGVFFNNSTPPAASISKILHSSQTVSSGEYWLILFASLAFLPLLAPRALILSVPWIGWTFLTDSSRFTTLGAQYSMVAAAPLFIGLAYGLRRVNPAPKIEEVDATAAARTSSSRGGSRARLGGLRRGIHSRALWGTVLGAVVVANVMLMPVNPLLTDLGIKAGNPFETGYFDHSLTWSPAIVPAESLAGLVPPDASVAAPSPLFPLIANHAEAVVLLPAHLMHTSTLPFNISTGPEYVLAWEGYLYAIYPALERNVSNPLVYGMRGYVSSSTLGPLLLYEKGFAGSAEAFGPVPDALNATNLPSDGLKAGPIGVQVANESAPGRTAIVSVPSTGKSTLVWTTGSAFLPAGSYTFRFMVSLAAENETIAPSASVMGINVGGFNGTLAGLSYPASSLPVGQWVNLTWNVTLASPLPDMVVSGFLHNPSATIAVAAVSVEPAP
jgi:uncharacterized membrane protein